MFRAFAGSTFTMQGEIAISIRCRPVSTENLWKTSSQFMTPVLSTRAGWIEYARLVEQAGAVALELNMYHIPTDLLESGRDIEARYVDIVDAVCGSIAIPVSVKLTPYLSSIGHFAATLVERGAAGLVLFNRLLHPEIDLLRMRLADQFDRVHGDRNQREREQREDRCRGGPFNRGFRAQDAHRRIDGEDRVEGPKYQMHPPQEGGANDEEQGIGPARRVQPSNQKEETRGGGADSQGVRAGVAGRVVEALERQAGEHGEPSRLRMNQACGQPRDQP